MSSSQADKKSKKRRNSEAAKLGSAKKAKPSGPTIKDLLLRSSIQSPEKRDQVHGSVEDSTTRSDPTSTPQHTDQDLFPKTTEGSQIAPKKKKKKKTKKLESSQPLQAPSSDVDSACPYSVSILNLRQHFASRKSHPSDHQRTTLVDAAAAAAAAASTTVAPPSPTSPSCQIWQATQGPSSCAPSATNGGVFLELTMPQEGKDGKVENENPSVESGKKKRSSSKKDKKKKKSEVEKSEIELGAPKSTKLKRHPAPAPPPQPQPPPPSLAEAESYSELEMSQTRQLLGGYDSDSTNVDSSQQPTLPSPPSQKPKKSQRSKKSNKSTSEEHQSQGGGREEVEPKKKKDKKKKSKKGKEKEQEKVGCEVDENCDGARQDMQADFFSPPTDIDMNIVEISSQEDFGNDDGHAFDFTQLKNEPQSASAATTVCDHEQTQAQSPSNATESPMEEDLSATQRQQQQVAVDEELTQPMSPEFISKSIKSLTARTTHPRNSNVGENGFSPNERAMMEVEETQPLPAAATQSNSVFSPRSLGGARLSQSPASRQGFVVGEFRKSSELLDFETQSVSPRIEPPTADQPSQARSAFVIEDDDALDSQELLEALEAFEKQQQQMNSAPSRTEPSTSVQTNHAPASSTANGNGLPPRPKQFGTSASLRPPTSSAPAATQKQVKPAAPHEVASNAASSQSSSVQTTRQPQPTITIERSPNRSTNPSLAKATAAPSTPQNGTPDGAMGSLQMGRLEATNGTSAKPTKNASPLSRAKEHAYYEYQTMGKSVDQIARQNHIKFNTVLSYLADAAAHGYPLDYTRLELPMGLSLAVRNLCDKMHTSRMKELKSALPAHISYPQLSLALCMLGLKPGSGSNTPSPATPSPKHASVTPTHSHPPHIDLDSSFDQFLTNLSSQDLESLTNPSFGKSQQEPEHFSGQKPSFAITPPASQNRSQQSTILNSLSLSLSSQSNPQSQKVCGSENGRGAGPAQPAPPQSQQQPKQPAFVRPPRQFGVTPSKIQPAPPPPPALPAQGPKDFERNSTQQSQGPSPNLPQPPPRRVSQFAGQKSAPSAAVPPPPTNQTQAPSQFHQSPDNRKTSASRAPSQPPPSQVLPKSLPTNQHSQPPHFPQKPTFNTGARGSLSATAVATAHAVGIMGRQPPTTMLASSPLKPRFEAGAWQSTGVVGMNAGGARRITRD